MNFEITADNPLKELLAESVYDPFYQPMSAASAVFLELLYEGVENTVPEQSSIAYQKEINQCQLDYSLASLARLDLLLRAIKKQHPIEIDDLDAKPAVGKFYMFLLVYTGEVFGRAVGQAVRWFSQEELNLPVLFSSAKPASLWFPQEESINDWIYANPAMQQNSTAFIAIFSTDGEALRQGNTGILLPMKALWSMLFETQYYSLYDYAAHNLKAYGIAKIAVQEGAPAPKLYLEAGFKQKLQQLTPMQRYYLQIRKPAWLKGDENDPLFRQLLAMKDLFKEGKIVWAAVVQANESMYLAKDRNKFSSAAEVLYDPAGRTAAGQLKTYAAQLAALKEGHTEDSEQAAHAARLQAENQSISAGVIPKSISHLPLQVSSVFLWRKHFPNGLLSLDVFPILISEKHAGIVMPLPSRFWPDSLTEQWLNAAKALYNGSSCDIQQALLEKENYGVPAWTPGTSVDPDQFHHPELYPKLTDLFPDHLYPEEKAQKPAHESEEEQIFVNNPSFTWMNMVYAADHAETEEERQRLTAEAEKFRAEHFFEGSFRHGEPVKIYRSGEQRLADFERDLEEARLTGDITAVDRVMHEHGIDQQAWESAKHQADRKMEEYQRQQRPKLSPFTRMIIAVAVMFILGWIFG